MVSESKVITAEEAKSTADGCYECNEIFYRISKAAAKGEYAVLVNRSELVKSGIGRLKNLGYLIDTVGNVWHVRWDKKPLEETEKS
jgi:hypothetical protein